MDGSDPATFAVSVGSRVVTAEGHDVGEVTDVQGAYFKVKSPMRQDFWLSKATLQRAEGESALLSFDEEQLEAFKLSSPGVESESPILEAQANVFSSGDDQARRREEMVRGYGHISQPNVSQPNVSQQNADEMPTASTPGPTPMSGPNAFPGGTHSDEEPEEDGHGRRKRAGIWGAVVAIMSLAILFFMRRRKKAGAVDRKEKAHDDPGSTTDDGDVTHVLKRTGQKAAPEERGVASGAGGKRRRGYRTAA